MEQRSRGACVGVLAVASQRAAEDREAHEFFGWEGASIETRSSDAPGCHSSSLSKFCPRRCNANGWHNVVILPITPCPTPIEPCHYHEAERRLPLLLIFWCLACFILADFVGSSSQKVAHHPDHPEIRAPPTLKSRRLPATASTKGYVHPTPWLHSATTCCRPSTSCKTSSSTPLATTRLTCLRLYDRVPPLALTTTSPADTSFLSVSYRSSLAPSLLASPLSSRILSGAISCREAVAL